MAVVRSQPGMSADQLIRQFNKKVQLEGILAELREREHYEKPSQKRQKRRKEAQRKMKSSRFRE